MMTVDHLTHTLAQTAFFPQRTIAKGAAIKLRMKFSQHGLPCTTKNFNKMDSPTAVNEIAHTVRGKWLTNIMQKWNVLDCSSVWLQLGQRCVESEWGHSRAETCERQHKLGLQCLHTHTHTHRPRLHKLLLGPTHASCTGLIGSRSVVCFCVRRRRNCFQWRYSHADKLK